MDGLGLVVDLAREVATRAYAAKQLRDDCVSLARLVDKLCDVLEAVRGLLESCATGIVQTLLQDMTKELQEASQFVEKTQTYSFLRLACQSGKLAAKLSGVKEGLTDCMARLMGVGGMSMAGTHQQRLEQRMGAMERTVVRAFQAQARRTEAAQLEALEVDVAELHRKVEKCNAGTAAVNVEQLQQELQAMAYQVKGKAATVSELEAALQEYRTELAHVHGKMQEMEDLMLAQVISLLDKCSHTDCQGQKEQARGTVKVPDSQPPAHLLCPISFDLMEDPVVLVESGHTFDRASIQEWLDRGNKVCPMTRRPLSSRQLVPNYALRDAIREWSAGATGGRSGGSSVLVGAALTGQQRPLQPGQVRPLPDTQPADGSAGQLPEASPVASAHSGRTLATSSDDHTAALWDGSTGQPLRVRVLRHVCCVNAVAWSPDGRTLATGSWDDTAALWDVSTGHQLQVLKGHSNHVSAVAWSPDGRTLATGSWDNTAALWDVSTGHQLQVLKGHSNHVSAVAWSPDGSTLATGSWDRTAALWDGSTGQQLRVLRGHGSNTVWAVAWSPDGRTLATGSWDETAALWDGSTGQRLRVLRGHELCVDAVAWSPDGRTLATGSSDRTARLWDGSTGQQLRVLKCSWIVKAVAWSPDGRTLATGSLDGRAELWDVGV